MATGENPSNLESIMQKLAILKEKQESLVAENTELKKRNAGLESKLRDITDKNQVLEKEYDRVKLAKTIVTNTSDKAEMKFRVNELVREIDKCIALLNR
jgi:predicted nuclease with TOPRIM domain